MSEQGKNFESIRITKATFLVAFGCTMVLTLTAFGASLGYDFLIFDDPYLIYNNLAARGFTLENLYKAFSTFDPELYIPLTILSYQLDFTLGGLDPTVYHVSNILLHVGNALLLSSIVFLLIGRKNIALVTGLLYAVHPLNTEAVVWLSGRKDLLSTFFYLGALSAYIRFRYTGIRKQYWISLGSFFLGLLAKATVLTLPLGILLIEALMRSKNEWRKKVFIEIAPFFALSGAGAVIAIVAKKRVIESLSLFETMLMAAKSTVFYVWKLLLPINLSPLYPYNEKISIFSEDFFVPLIIVLCITIFAVWSLRKTKWILVCLAGFVLALAPSFFNVHKGVSIFFAVDRYAYLPSIWLFILLAAGLGAFAERWGGRRFFITNTCFLSAVVGTLTMISIQQTSYWQSNETLFSRALSLYPDSESARISLSVVYREHGDTKMERSILEEGLALSERVSYYVGLGSIAAREGDMVLARDYYEKGRSLDPLNPEPLFYLGTLDEVEGDTANARVKYQDAIDLDPSYVAAYNNLGAIYLDREEFSKAEEAFRSALQWNPNFMEGHYNLFQVLEIMKRNDEAFRHLAAAYSLNPNSADIALAFAYRLYERGNLRESAESLHKLLLIDPENRTAKRLLSQIQSQEETASADSSSVSPLTPSERAKMRGANRK